MNKNINNNLDKLAMEIKKFGGYLFNCDEIVKEGTYATKGKLGNDEIKLSIDFNTILGISSRTDNNIKVTLTKTLAKNIKKRFFMIIPQRYKRQLYREQIITYMMDKLV